MEKILLHTCCAPCSIAVIDELKKQFELTVFFYNPNIYPKEEYLKRKAEVVRVCQEWQIPMVDRDYESEKWLEAIQGLEKENEGGKRCGVCFRLRLEKTAQYAQENNFAIFATSLTSGRNKDAQIINPLGIFLAEKYGIKFSDIDWKKEGRQEKGRQLTEERGIYRQDYCGCVFSWQNKPKKASAS